MAPRFVAPYRKNGKNDGNDAEAICEAVSRPSMRFVPIKTLEQQAVLCLHRVRQGFVEERTATINRLRGLLGGVGFVLPQKAGEGGRRGARRARRAWGGVGFCAAAESRRGAPACDRVARTNAATRGRRDSRSARASAGRGWTGGGAGGARGRRWPAG